LAPAHANLGRVFELQRLPDQAVEEYRAAVRGGRSPEALYNWANLESRRGRGETAIRLYREALRLEPGFADARFNWGNTLARSGRLREAAAQYKLLLSDRPGDAQAAESLRRVSAALGR
jgi:tetratricopeptide (TPR) repeat protein